MKNVKIVLKRLLVGMFSLTFLTLTLTGCLDSDDNNPDVPYALVSLYHGSPNGPSLDVEVDNNQINFYPFDYAEYTGYFRFYAGDRNLKFGPYAASNIVIDTTVTFEENHAYSVFVVDNYHNASIVVLNDNSDLPAEGNAKVRVINLSPDASALDLTIEGDVNAVAEDLSFKEASDFIEVDATEYDFLIRSSSNDEVVLTLPGINLQPRYYYTIIIRGYATPSEGNTNVLSA